jgi:hypothetical protein
VVAEHTRSVTDVPERVERIRSAARDCAHFWVGRLDLDALAWEVSEPLADLAAGNARVDRATDRATTYWERLYGDDELLVWFNEPHVSNGPTENLNLKNTKRTAQGYRSIRN